MDMLCDLLTPLLEDGYQRILILNGHGGNIDTMQMALRRLQPQYRDRILAAASYWDLAAKELAALAEGPRKTMGHACEFETSMMLALRPDLVPAPQDQERSTARRPPACAACISRKDMRQRTDHGAVGYPELATAEKGQKFLAAAIERTVEVVSDVVETAVAA